MAAGAFGALSSLAGWAIVPDLATRQLLNIIHRLLQTYLHLAPPQPGTPAYRQHYAYTFAFVVLGYLLYNMVQSAMSMPPNFYEIMGVASSVDEQGLKAAFKQWAKKYHPDRPGVGPDGEALFMLVRDAYEALKDPVKRFAYDRFGPDVLSWKDCSTPREYLHRGLLQSSGYHITVGAGLLFWSAIGQPSPVSFWRFILYALVLALEVTLLVGPSAPTSSESISQLPTSFLTNIFPQRVAYQHILFLHQVFMFFSVALSRVAPQFASPTRIVPATYDNLQGISALLDREASMLVHTHLQSIHPDADISASPSSGPSPSTSRSHSHLSIPPGSRPCLARMQPLMTPSHQILEALTKEMEELVIETNVKKDSGPLKMAWESAIRKLNWGGPGPARRKDGESSNSRAHGSASPQKFGSPQAKNWWENPFIKTEDIDGDFISINANPSSSPIRGGSGANGMLSSPIPDRGLMSSGAAARRFPSTQMGEITSPSTSRVLFSNGNALQFKKAAGEDGEGSRPNYVRARSVSY
ncbi:hypothetical protein AX16_000895 [Volvariella volvacea WC 439]|nr:hypothetical protein AX16_000895 [Volvariella volvacea WC 439]